MNQAIFAKILVSEDGVQDSVLAQPFADLWSEEFVEVLERATTELRGPKKVNGRRLSSTGSWNENVMARPERFELPTFGSVDRRSIQLSYGRQRPILASAQRRARAGGRAHRLGDPGHERSGGLEL